MLISDLFKEFASDMHQRKVLLFCAQLCVSATALGRLGWRLVTAIKVRTMSPFDTGFLPWTRIFFNPIDSGLLNYLVLCAVMGLCALLAYLLWNKRTLQALEQRLAGKHPLLLVTLLLFSVVFVFYHRDGGRYYSLLLLFIVCVPALMLLTDLINPMAWVKRTGRAPGLILVGCLLLLALMVVKEPVRLATGPVYLMNEYPDLFGETLVKGRFVRNDEFLRRLNKDDIGLIKAFFEMREMIEGPSSHVETGNDLDFFRLLPPADLDATQRQLLSTLKPGGQDAGGPPYGEGLLKGLQRVNVEEVRQFFLYNCLEYPHQNMGRGQVNHLGHIYNPLNEYRLGRPLKEVYFQYGLGNTFLMQWVMDVFGGLSVQAYHKLYLFYVLYVALFIAMAVILFRDPLYILGVFAGYAAAFFWAGHIGLVLGAGIIPSIHLLNAVAIMLLALYLRRGQLLLLGLLGLSCMASIFLNTKFGMMLTVSIFAGVLLHAIETRERAGGLLRIAGTVAGFLLVVLIPVLAMPKSSGTYVGYFFAGYFSWLPNPAIVFLTVVYLVGSYAFMLLLKRETFDLKYTYLASALYAQCLFIYYYWSGLSNHLPMVMPFLALQCFIALYVLVFRFPIPFLSRSAQLLTPLLVLALLFFCVRTWSSFQTQQREFYENFQQHRTYQWEFDKARVVATLDPKPLADTVALIRKYAPGPGKGIHLISKYDGLIPFIADRYSALPHFELGYSLLSEEAVRQAVTSIRADKPKYLFVDSNLIRFVPSPSVDPWSKIFVSAFDERERAARLGRYAALHAVFSGVADAYERVEDNGLVTVLGRKEGAGHGS